MDALIWLKRKLDPVVGRLGVRPVARGAYRQLLRWRYGRDGLAVVRQNDRTWKLHYEVALRGEFAEFDTILWLRSVVKPGDCVFDIGANVGQMTLEAAELVGPTGRVIAVEPAPGNVRLLRRHVEANGFADRVTIVEAACGKTHGGSLTLHVYGDTADAIGSGHTVNAQKLPGDTIAITVPMVSVDGLAATTAPMVLKIDVEGAELDVLYGAESTLRLHRPVLQVGFHPFAFDAPRSASTALCQVLDRCGYNPPPLNVGGAFDLAEYHIVPREEAVVV